MSHVTKKRKNVIFASSQATCALLQQSLLIPKRTEKLLAGQYTIILLHTLDNTAEGKFYSTEQLLKNYSLLKTAV